MKILFQGDSVTDAGRTGCGYENLGRGYPIFAAGEILSSHPGKGIEIINRGISGNRVVDLYQRWKADCLNLKPDVISILIGVNDTWHERSFQNGVEVPRAEKVYRELISWTKEVLPDVKLILCEPFMFRASIAGEGYEVGQNWAADDSWEEEVKARGAFVRKIADDYGALFIPFQEILDSALESAPAPYWLLDGVHPTIAGHALMAKSWLRLAAPYIGL